MEPLPPGLVAHKGLRGQILLELKRAQPLTTNELADRFAVSANAIRRHLKELEVEELVEHDREQRGQGAPTHAYHLTVTGEALFPKRYDEALTDVLAFVARTAGRQEVQRIFEQRFRTQAKRLRSDLTDATVEERLEAVADLLSREGFMAEWSADAGRVRIAEHNCALRTAAERFPEICAAEADFLRDVLQADVRRIAYIPDGCNSCEYAVTLGEADRPPVERPQES